MAEVGEQMMIGDEIYVWTGFPSGWQSNSASFSGPGGGTGTFDRVGDVYVPRAITPPAPTLNAPAVPLASGGGGTFGTVAPGVVTNPIFNGVGTTAVISDDSALAGLKAFASEMYGSSELGVIRNSSEVLENEPSGIRPGTMERIVIPSWARRERGSPI